MAEPSTSGSWASVDWHEVFATIGTSALIGTIRLGYLVRRGREFRLIDVVLDPSLAVFGGMLMWAAAEYAGTPDLVQAIGTSLGAWAGPRAIVVMERKYLSALATGTTGPIPLDSEH